MHDHFIYIISGTNRPASSTLRVARVVQRHYAQRNIDADLLDLEDLPQELFSPLAYTTKPPAFMKYQEAVLRAAGLHIVMPEYNGSFPGALKYFVDMLKFPESFERKPVAFVGLAAGQFGGLRAVEQMQMVFAYRNAHLYPDRVFVPSVRAKLDSTGGLNDAELDARIERQASGFAEFCGLFARARA